MRFHLLLLLVGFILPVAAHGSIWPKDLSNPKSEEIQIPDSNLPLSKSFLERNLRQVVGQTIEIDGVIYAHSGAPKVFLDFEKNLLGITLFDVKASDGPLAGVEVDVLYFQFAPVVVFEDGQLSISLVGQAKSLYSRDLDYLFWGLVIRRINENLRDVQLINIPVTEFGPACGADASPDHSVVWVGASSLVIQIQCFNPPRDHLIDLVETVTASATLPKTRNESSNRFLRVGLPVGYRTQNVLTQIKNQTWPQSCILGPNNEFNECSPGTDWCSVGWASVGDLLVQPDAVSARFYSWSHCNERTARLSVTYAIAKPLNGTPILFDFDDATLSPQSEVSLVSNVSLAGEFTSIVVTGHTDLVGSVEYNEGLALRRANSVKEFLVASGLVEAEQISVVTAGETQPISSVDGDLSEDRRVHLHFLRN